MDKVCDLFRVHSDVKSLIEIARRLPNVKVVFFGQREQLVHIFDCFGQDLEYFVPIISNSWVRDGPSGRTQHYPQDELSPHLWSVCDTMEVNCSGYLTEALIRERRCTS